LVIIAGKKKPFRTVLSKKDYAAVRALGEEFRARKPRSVENDEPEAGATRA
jgi:hypothetical protein